jgi:hypothetical protein
MTAWGRHVRAPVRFRICWSAHGQFAAARSPGDAPVCGSVSLHCSPGRSRPCSRRGCAAHSGLDWGMESWTSWRGEPSQAHPPLCSTPATPELARSRGRHVNATAAAQLDYAWPRRNWTAPPEALLGPSLPFALRRRSGDSTCILTTVETGRSAPGIRRTGTLARSVRSSDTERRGPKSIPALLLAGPTRPAHDPINPPSTVGRAEIREFRLCRGDGRSLRQGCPLFRGSAAGSRQLPERGGEFIGRTGGGRAGKMSNH